MWIDETFLIERVVELFKNKKEVSLQKDILPIVKNIYMYSPVDTITTETMNSAITKAMDIVNSKGVYYTVHPVFAVEHGISVVDMMYKAIH